MVVAACLIFCTMTPIAALSDAQPESPQIGVQPSAVSPRQCLELAMAKRRGGDLAAAEAYFRQALSLEPTLRGIHYELAMIRYELGDMKGAYAEVGAEVSLSGPTLDTENLTGAIFLKIQRYDEALDTFQRACSLAPENPVPWNNLCEAARLLDRWELAASALDKVIELKPLDTLAKLRKQLIRLSRGESAQVRTEIEQNRQQSPYDPWVDAAAVALELADEHWPEARNEWSAFVRRANPDFVEAVRKDQFYARRALTEPAKFLAKP